MRKLLQLAVLLLAAPLAYAQCSATPPAQAAGYSCVFQDLFTPLSLTTFTNNNPAYNWYQGVFIWPNSGSITNPSNTALINWVPADGSGGTYMSTTSANGTGRAWKYGYFQAVLKFNPVTGNWPAFWMFANQMNQSGVQTGGELDGIEWQSNTPTTGYGTVHSWVNGSDVGNNNGSNTWALPGGTDLSQYHTYGFLWTPTEIKWYFDNTLVESYPTTSEPFNTAFNNSGPFYLILNETAGCYFTQPCAGQASPLNMQVQSVEVFQQSTGNACPTAANYVNPSNPTGSLVTLASLGINSCYYVDAAGSDSATGADESHPWAHAPFMPSATGVPAALASSLSGTGAAGLGFIFKGGDTWHFGDSGSSPYTGGTWEFNTGTLWSGTSANPIYFGVDPAWFSGSSWTRPIFTGDSPPCGPGTVGGNCNAYSANYWQQYYVSSCPHTISGSNMLDVSWISHYIFDNFEMTGMCMNSVGQPFSSNEYVTYNSVHGQQTFENLYIHGWSHTAFAGPNGSGSCTGSNVCMDQYAFGGTPLDTTSTPSDKLLFDVVDGSDSDPVALGAAFAPWYDVSYSAFRYTSQGLIRQLHTFHDNLYEYFFENGHSNVLENTSEWTGNNVVYNNVFRHLEDVGGTNGAGVWLEPGIGKTDYFFDNSIYTEGQMELYNVGNTEGVGNIGTQILFNNTMDFTSGTGNDIACQPGGYANPVDTTNNHFITETTAVSSTCSGQWTAVTDLSMNHATAAAAGYNVSQTYANSPTFRVESDCRR